MRDPVRLLTVIALVVGARAADAAEALAPPPPLRIASPSEIVFLERTGEGFVRLRPDRPASFLVVGPAKLRAELRVDLPHEDHTAAATTLTVMLNGKPLASIRGAHRPGTDRWRPPRAQTPASSWMTVARPAQVVAAPSAPFEVLLDVAPGEQRYDFLVDGLAVHGAAIRLDDRPPASDARVLPSVPPPARLVLEAPRPASARPLTIDYLGAEGPFAARAALGVSASTHTTYVTYHEEDTPGRSGSLVMTAASFGWQISRRTQLTARGAWARNAPPPGGAAGEAWSNPTVAVSHGRDLGAGFRAVPHLAVIIPVGSGGGNTPRPEQRATFGTVRPVDNAQWDPNYVTVQPGVLVSWSNDHVYSFVDSVLVRQDRTRGEDVTVDPLRTSAIARGHLGFLAARRSVEVWTEASYRRYLSRPKVLEVEPAAIDLVSVSGGVTVKVPLGKTTTLQPRVRYARPVDDPVARRGYQLVEVGFQLVL